MSQFLPSLSRLRLSVPVDTEACDFSTASNIKNTLESPVLVYAVVETPPPFNWKVLPPGRAPLAGKQLRSLFNKETRLLFEAPNGGEIMKLEVKGTLGTGGYGVVMDVEEQGKEGKVRKWAMKVLSPVDEDAEDWWGDGGNERVHYRYSTEGMKENLTLAMDEAKLMKLMAIIQVGIPVRTDDFFFMDVRTGLLFLFMERANGSMNEFIKSKRNASRLKLLGEPTMEYSIYEMLYRQACYGTMCFDQKLENMLYKTDNARRLCDVYISDFDKRFCSSKPTRGRCEAYARLVCLGLSADNLSNNIILFKEVLEYEWTYDVWSEIKSICQERTENGEKGVLEQMYRYFRRTLRERVEKDTKAPTIHDVNGLKDILVHDGNDGANKVDTWKKVHSYLRHLLSTVRPTGAPTQEPVQSTRQISDASIQVRLLLSEARTALKRYNHSWVETLNERLCRPLFDNSKTKTGDCAINVGGDLDGKHEQLSKAVDLALRAAFDDGEFSYSATINEGVDTDNVCKLVGELGEVAENVKTAFDNAMTSRRRLENFTGKRLNLDPSIFDKLEELPIHR